MLFLTVCSLGTTKCTYDADGWALGLIDLIIVRAGASVTVAFAALAITQRFAPRVESNVARFAVNAAVAIGTFTVMWWLAGEVFALIGLVKGGGVPG